MKQFTDQIGRVINLDTTPKRIVSLVPSITELLVDLGLEDQIVGVTKFCTPPVTIRNEKASIGGTKNIDLSKISDLQADLILASKEENVKEQIEALNVPTWVSDVSSLADAKEMITMIGEMTDTVQIASNIVEQLKFPPKNINKRVAYLIWRKPYMTIGNDTLIHDMLQRAGFDNVFADQKRYPVITLEDIVKKKPDYIFLSSEPFPFTKRFFTEFEQIAPPILVDGELFSWFGSRLINSSTYFELLNEQLPQ